MRGFGLAVLATITKVRGPGLAVLVTVTICGCFYYGFASSIPHLTTPLAQERAMEFGFISALCWGWSVVGALIGGPVAVLSRPQWNSWMNLFAAAFAAIAVGYAAPY